PHGRESRQLRPSHSAARFEQTLLSRGPSFARARYFPCLRRAQTCTRMHGPRQRSGMFSEFGSVEPNSETTNYVTLPSWQPWALQPGHLRMHVWLTRERSCARGGPSHACGHGDLEDSTSKTPFVFGGKLGSLP